LSGKEVKHLIAPQLLAQDGCAGRIGTVCLKTFLARFRPMMMKFVTNPSLSEIFLMASCMRPARHRRTRVGQLSLDDRFTLTRHC
jgi:hypothetical protein